MDFRTCVVATKNRKRRQVSATLRSTDRFNLKWELYERCVIRHAHPYPRRSTVLPRPMRGPTAVRTARGEGGFSGALGFSAARCVDLKSRYE
jgi:hypothetical protein